MMDNKNSDPGETEEETEHKEAAVLPAREAMTIISPSTGGGFLPDLSSVPSAEGATQSADSVAAEADASGSAEESETSEDRSEHFESDDSASSQN